MTPDGVLDEEGEVNLERREMMRFLRAALSKVPETSVSPMSHPHNSGKL